MWEFLVARFTELHGWLFEALVQPVLYRLGFMAYSEMAFDGSELFLLGVVELAVLYAIFRPLEALAPVEKWPDRHDADSDFLYSAISKLGVLPLFFFFLFTPAFDEINAQLRLQGIIPPNLEDFFPALNGAPVLSAFCYLALLDFTDYWRHRWQHRFRVWWALHAVHHSQRQMTFWTDDREHLLDHAINAIWRSLIGLAIGAPPVQFLTVTLLSGAIESLSHANVRLSFGWLGERLVVSPRFHRLHHAMTVGHDGKHFGCNFAAVFSFWDVLFGTANFDPGFHPTGIADQLEGHDYGQGFWSQQWLGLRRMWAR